MIILHPFSKEREADQRETWTALEQVRQAYPVADRLCEGDYGYDDFLKEHWGIDDILIVEQDIVATMHEIEILEECMYPYCTWGYRCSPHGVTFAFGLCKIERSAQERALAEEWWRKGAWGNLDVRVMQLLDARVGPSHKHDSPLMRHNYSETVT